MVREIGIAINKFKQNIELQYKNKIMTNSEKLGALKEGDKIAFPFEGKKGPEIMVSLVKLAKEDTVSVSFMHAMKPVNHEVVKTDIIGIADQESMSRIKGHAGTFDILLPRHELLKK